MSALSYIRDADRAMGLKSDLAVTELDRWSYPYVFRSEIDRLVDLSGRWPLLSRIRFFLGLMFHYDVLVTYYNACFFVAGLLRLLQWPLLKLAGLRIVVVSYGSDVTLFDSPPTRFDWVGRRLIDYPPNGSPEEHDARIRRGIEDLTRWADFRIAGDHTLSPMVPEFDLVFKYFPIDCDNWPKTARTSEGPPRIVHAPNHRHIKGTATLQEVCQKLTGDDIPLELQIVEGVPRNEVQALYAESDLLVEDLCSGASGLNGFEFMALGKPVLVFIDAPQLDDPAFDLPYVNTNIENVEAVLRAVLQVSELRSRLGEAGRRAVEEFQSFLPIAEVWHRIYQHVCYHTPLDLDSTRHFAPTRRSRPRTEDPMTEAFWPVDVTDLLADIRRAITGSDARQPECDSDQHPASSTILLEPLS